MLNIRRWWEEFRNPSLKCERVGHKWHTRTVKILKKPEPRNIGLWVAERWKAEVTICRRCGAEQPIKLIEELRCYHSLTMSSDKWDDMREKGYILD